MCFHLDGNFQMDVSPPPIFDGNEEANARVLTEFSRNSLDPREDVEYQV